MVFSPSTEANHMIYENSLFFLMPKSLVLIFRKTLLLEPKRPFCAVFVCLKGAESRTSPAFFGLIYARARRNNLSLFAVGECFSSEVGNITS